LVYCEQDFYPYKGRGQKPRMKVEKKFFQTCPKKNRKKGILGNGWEERLVTFLALNNDKQKS